MEETKDSAAKEMEMENTEMAFEDSQSHLVSKSKFGYELGDQKAQFRQSAVIHNQPRFKTFQSLGFQGNP